MLTKFWDSVQCSVLGILTFKIHVLKARERNFSEGEFWDSVQCTVFPFLVRYADYVLGQLIPEYS
jgi:hypothetical protein